MLWASIPASFLLIIGNAGTHNNSAGTDINHLLSYIFFQQSSLCNYFPFAVITIMNNLHPISIMSIMICQAVISHVLCGNCGILQFHNAQPLFCYKSNSSLGFLINIFCMKAERFHSHQFERIFIMTSVAAISLLYCLICSLVD